MQGPLPDYVISKLLRTLSTVGRTNIKRLQCTLACSTRKYYLEAESFTQLPSTHKMASLEFPSESTAQILIHWAIAQQIIERPLI
jgi:hypothetical protein